MTDTKIKPETVTVIGGGMAGSEAALQLARRGIPVKLYEMRPATMTPAHKTQNLAELVCSNSFRARDPLNAVGLLKEEMDRLGSAFMTAAFKAEVPAGGALAVDRDAFSGIMTSWVENEPLIEVIRTEMDELPEGRVIVATGPLTSDKLAARIQALTGEERLHFYDAIAPVIDAESIDMDKAFFASRYDKGGADYLNLPFNEDEYNQLIADILAADKVPLREFEKPRYFEGCMPIETLVERGPQTLAFGAMKPVGLIDPATGKRPHAVLQLRTENHEKTAFNMVGFQTRMTYGAQKQVFRSIPGLENAEFLRLGSVHRNSFIDAPRILTMDLSVKTAPSIRFAGQVSGVEGYVESAASGLMAALFTAAEIAGEPLEPPPAETILGGMIRYLVEEREDFQPSNVTHAMIPGPNKKMKKKDRKAHYRDRARGALTDWLDRINHARQEFGD